MRLLLLLFFFPILAFAEEITIDGIQFAYQVPAKHNENSAIMVLFGGRNWPGEKTLKTYEFNELSDKHHLFLISPSFKDREYWKPEKWSGKCLLRGVVELEKQYHLKPQKLYFYGYSAGGQCSALFYDWMPERVAAWGAHACGVYPATIKHVSAPALITCGREDAERFQISRHFIYRYRENGGSLLWKPFPGVHELNREALELVRAWFDSLLSSEKVTEYGEDDTKQNKTNIDIEYRNPLTSKTKELWLK